MILATDFVEPGWFLLLLGLPLIVWWLRPSPGARGFKGRVLLGMRLLALALLVSALARPRLLDEVHQLAVVFLLDVSDSVPPEQRQRALGKIETYFEAMPEGDRGALVVFGDRPSIEVPLRGAGVEGDAGFAARLDNLESRLGVTQSDLGTAIAYGEGLMPDNVAKRLVLVSDGNETRGDLIGAARALQASQTRLDVLPIRYRYDREVIVEGLQGTGRGQVGEPYQLRAVISSQTRTDAELVLFENGVPMGDPVSVELREGTNVFRFSPMPEAAGYYQYDLTVHAKDDGNLANNQGRAGVLIQGEPRVMVVATGEEDMRIASVLEGLMISVDRHYPNRLPRHPAGYVGTDCVVLHNVASFEMDRFQQEALRDAVKELGIGLVVIGGDKAFGPGGYRGTPIEGLLPVRLDTNNRKTMPKGALAIVLHSIEFDSGNTWAIKICRAAFDGMNPDDEGGVVYYDNADGEKWLFDLAPLGDRKEQYRLIDEVRVGDMPSFDRCFQHVDQSMGKTDASVKHVVVISDGDPQLPAPNLLDSLKSNKVTISTICISPHGPTSIPAMKRLAREGRGRFVEVKADNLVALPKLMIKEAATLRRAAVKEEDFTPLVLLGGSPLLRGMEEGFPELGGYVITSMKSGAETILLADDEEDDPLLAAWHIGLGRVVAFTSDASTRWASKWYGWNKFGPFWAQTVRSAIQSVGASGFPMRVRADGAELVVEMIATEDDGSPSLDLAVRGALLREGSDALPFEMTQRDAGVYSARVDAKDPGHYLVRLDYEIDGEAARSTAVSAIDFAPEYRSLRSREDLLAAAADITGGQVYAGEENPFAHDFAGIRGQVDLWPYVLALVGMLMVVEIFFRRYDLAFLTVWFAKVRASRERRADERAKEEDRRRSLESRTPSTEGEPDQGYVPRPQESAQEKKKVSKPTQERTSDKDDDVLNELKKAKKRAERRRDWR